MSQGAAGALSGAYDENTDAVKKLTDQIKSWCDQYQQDALSQPASDEENTPASAIAGPPTGGGGMSPPRRLTSPNSSGGWATVGGILGTAVANMGSNNILGKIVAMNTYVQMGSYMGSASAGAALNQAVGSGAGGAGNRYNYIANGTQDAMQQFQIMQQASGQQMLNSGPLGRSMMNASFGAGYINPGMSGTQSAQFGAQLYSPNTSLYMRQFGIAPLTQGGQGVSAQPGTIALNILNKMTLGRGVSSPQQLATLMRSGGAGQASYNFVTGGQIPMQTMLPMMEVANKLQSQGVSQNKMNWAMSQAGHGNSAADKFLAQHNIPESDVLKMHKAMSPNMARSGDQYSGMEQGLSMATSAVFAFNTQFSKWMKLTHMDTPTGMAQGFGGTMSMLEPGPHLPGHGGGLLGGLLGLGAKYLLGKQAWKGGKALFNVGKTLLGKAPKLLPDLGASAAAAVPAAAVAGGFFAAQALTGHYKHKPKNVSWPDYISFLVHKGEISPHAELKYIRDRKGFIAEFNKGAEPGVETNVRGGGASGPPKSPANPSTAPATGASGQQIVDYAKQFIGHPYVLGGSGDYQTNHNAPYGPWDCAGFVSQMYEHFGMKGIPTINVGGLMKWGTKTSSPVVGGFATWVTDGSVQNPGHVGLITGPKSSIQAMDPALGTRASDLGGAIAFYVPPGLGSGGGTAAGGSSIIPAGGGGGGGGPKGGYGGTGDDLTGGSVQEKTAFLQAITGGIMGGSGYTGQNNGSLLAVSGAAGVTTGGPGNYTNPIPRGVRPERVDQGVDFAGNGPIKAMGDATIGTISGGGWPGGPYMSYQLKNGPQAGKWVYVAENIRPTVRPGQQVKAGDTIANMFDGGTGIETGWAGPGGGSPLSQSAAAGSIGGGNLPGNGSTAIGMAYERLLVALGAPKAPNFGAPSGGKVPPGYSGGGDVEVHHAHKTASFAPSDHTYSTLHPLYAGGRDLLPSNTQIILHFKSGSLEFEMPPGTESDMGASKKATFAKAHKLVTTNKLHVSISKGVK